METELFSRLLQETGLAGIVIVLVALAVRAVWKWWTTTWAPTKLEHGRKAADAMADIANLVRNSNQALQLMQQEMKDLRLDVAGIYARLGWERPSRCEDNR